MEINHMINAEHGQNSTPTEVATNTDGTDRSSVETTDASEPKSSPETTIPDAPTPCSDSFEVNAQLSRPSRRTQNSESAKITNKPRIKIGATEPAEGARTEKETTRSANQKLIVGQGIQLKGEITNCETLLVEGHIEGSATTRTIEIGDCGTFNGDAQSETVDVRGCYEGDLSVSNRLTIRSSGRVSGKIRYSAIEIEAGGEISGDVQVTHSTEANTLPAKPAAEPKVAHIPTLRETTRGCRRPTYTAQEP